MDIPVLSPGGGGTLPYVYSIFIFALDSCLVISARVPGLCFISSDNMSVKVTFSLEVLTVLRLAFNFPPH